MTPEQTSHFLSMYRMILADGIIDAKELETLYKIGIEQYGLTQDAITEVIRDSGSSLIMPSSLEEKVRFLYNLATIAYADGEVDDSERDLLKKYITNMGFDKENVEGIAEFLFESVKNNIPVKEILSQIE